MSGTPEIEIRDMNFEDVALVGELERTAYAFPWSEAIFRDCLRAGHYCAVVELDHQLIGYAVLSAGAGEAHVLNLCVSENFRCRGIGGHLLTHLLEFARSLKLADVYLEVRPSNTAAIRLYLSNGFAQIGVRRGYYQAAEGREDAVVLRRRLQKGSGG